MTSLTAKKNNDHNNSSLVPATKYLTKKKFIFLNTQKINKEIKLKSSLFVCEFIFYFYFIMAISFIFVLTVFLILFFEVLNFLNEIESISFFVFLFL